MEIDLIINKSDKFKANLVDRSFTKFITDNYENLKLNFLHYFYIDFS